MPGDSRTRGAKPPGRDAAASSARGVQNPSASESLSSAPCALSADWTPDPTRQRVGPPPCRKTLTPASAESAKATRGSTVPPRACSGYLFIQETRDRDGHQGRLGGGRTAPDRDESRVRRQFDGSEAKPSAPRRRPQGRRGDPNRTEWTAAIVGCGGSATGGCRTGTRKQVGAVRGTAGPRRRHPSVGTKETGTGSGSSRSRWLEQPHGRGVNREPIQGRRPRAPSRRPAWSGRRAHRSTRLLAPRPRRTLSRLRRSSASAVWSRSDPGPAPRSWISCQPAR